MADLRIPGFGAFTPEQEHQFQTFMAFDPSVRAWRTGFQNQYGEQPNTENDPTFNYREAWQAGNKPQPYAGDNGMYHWDSRGKAPDHQTAWMQGFLDKFGQDPMTLRPEQVTPEMQQFMQGQLPRGGLF